jgi:hypothetical protein
LSAGPSRPCPPIYSMSLYGPMTVTEGSAADVWSVVTPGRLPASSRECKRASTLTPRFRLPIASLTDPNFGGSGHQDDHPNSRTPNALRFRLSREAVKKGSNYGGFRRSRRRRLTPRRTPHRLLASETQMEALLKRIEWNRKESRPWSKTLGPRPAEIDKSPRGIYSLPDFREPAT